MKSDSEKINELLHKVIGTDWDPNDAEAQAEAVHDLVEAGELVRHCPTMDAREIFDGFSNDMLECLLLSSIIHLLSSLADNVASASESGVRLAKNLANKLTQNQLIGDPTNRENELLKLINKFSDALAGTTEEDDDMIVPPGFLKEVTDEILKALSAFDDQRLYTSRAFEALDPTLRFMAIQNFFLKSQQSL